MDLEVAGAAPVFHPNMQERFLHINETVVKRISDEERSALQDKLIDLVHLAKNLLGDKNFVTLMSSTGQFVQIVHPHGTRGHEDTEVIIEVFGTKLDYYQSKYLVFAGQIINRPNRWVDMEITDEFGNKTRKRINPSMKPGKENYEVGLEELNELLRLVQSLGDSN